MNRKSYIEKVTQFHQWFKLPVVETPEIPDASRCELRINLIQEELNELKQACDQGDIVEVADALCDLQYVLSGAILEFGLGDQFESLFDEVHRSNMSKACKTLDEAVKTQDFYKNKKNQESIIVKTQDKYLVYRKDDKKVLKSIEYSPADLKTIINQTPIEKRECE